MFKKVVWWEGFKNFLVLGSLDKRGIAMDSWMFNVDEKKKYERFVFENSMSTIGLGMRQLPWEQGVFAEVFGASGSVAMPSSVPQVAIPGAPLIEMSGSFTTPGDDVDPDLLVAPKDVPRYAKHVRALADKTYDEQTKLQWTKALACWLSILEGSNFESSVGVHVKVNLEEGDRDAALLCIRDACGVRSPNTALKRGRDIKLYITWVEKKVLTNWWPLQERSLLMYLDSCEFENKSKLIGKNLVHALKFFRFVMGAEFDLEKIVSPLMSGKISRITSTKAVTEQARALTVKEVQLLEKRLSTSSNILDKYFTGCLLYAIYTRSRWADMGNIDRLFFDVIETADGPFGFVEARTRIHKTSTTAERKAMYMPYVAPIQGVGGGYWGLDWKAVLEELQLIDPKRRPFGPVCRATRADGTFTCRALTSAEGTSMLNDFIEAVAGSADETTTHSLKSTTLVWAARYGMDDKSRCLLGHHTTKENSLACYSRNLLAKPLRDLCGMLLNVRLQKFNPDGTRSGWMAETQASFGVRPVETEDAVGADVPSGEAVEEPASPVYSLPTSMAMTTPAEEMADEKAESVVQECPVQDVLSDSEFELAGVIRDLGDEHFDPTNPFGELEWGDPLKDDAIPDVGNLGPNGGEDEHEYDPTGIDGEEVIESASSEDEESYESSGDEGKEEVFHNSQKRHGMLEREPAVKGNLMQNKRSRMLHLRCEDPENHLQPVTACGLHGNGFLELPNGSEFEWPLCSKCFKDNQRQESLVEVVNAGKRRRLKVD